MEAQVAGEGLLQALHMSDPQAGYLKTAFDSDRVDLKNLALRTAHNQIQTLELRLNDPSPSKADT
jgi:hypothetical protein